MPITGKVAIQPLLHAVKSWVPGDPIMPEVVLIPTGGAFEDQNHRWWPNNYSVSRMTSGLDLHKRYGLPLIISGGPMPGSQDSEAKLLVRFFNLEETADIRLEQHSRTTYDTARNVAQLLRPAGVKVVFLVTTDVHMTRMAALDGRKVILVISKITKNKTGRIWDRSECPLSGVKKTFFTAHQRVR